MTKEVTNISTARGLLLDVPEMLEDLLALDEVLDKLMAIDPTAAELVRLRFFAGLPLPKVAHLLGISPRTADRLWAYARAWLHQEIQDSAQKKVTFLQNPWRDLGQNSALKIER